MSELTTKEETELIQLLKESTNEQLVAAYRIAHKMTFAVEEEVNNRASAILTLIMKEINKR